MVTKREPQLIAHNYTKLLELSNAVICFLRKYNMAHAPEIIRS